MAVATDTLTLWHRVLVDLDHAEWEHHVLAGVRCEPLRASRGTHPGPTPSDGLRAYLFAGTGIQPGDRVACGISASPSPTAGSLEVTDVRAYSLGGFVHHVEVDAR